MKYHKFKHYDILFFVCFFGVDWRTGKSVKWANLEQVLRSERASAADRIYKILSHHRMMMMMMVMMMMMMMMIRC